MLERTGFPIYLTLTYKWGYRECPTEPFFFNAQTGITRAVQNCLPDPQQEYIRVSSTEVNQ